jgi:hypothetical protein
VPDSPVAAREARTELDAFLAEIRSESKANPRGRLIFALDATASRRPTWDAAGSLQAGMFREAAAIGNLDLQLVYFRGQNECKASRWLSDPGQLAHIMSRIECMAGETQIRKVLAHAKKETSLLHVGALVFVGDAREREDNPALLCSEARELGRLRTPAFMFQEGRDSEAEQVFREIAHASGGAYGRFDSSAAKQLGELLKAVARFAVGGTAALESGKDAASMLLRGQMKR